MVYARSCFAVTVHGKAYLFLAALTLCWVELDNYKLDSPILVEVRLTVFAFFQRLIKAVSFGEQAVWWHPFIEQVLHD